MTYRRIVMIGTGFDTKGGIASVVKVYAAQGLLARWQVRYLATHGDGPTRVKLALAVRAWLTYVGLLLAGRVALLHVHGASGPSFWRKFMFVAPTLALRRPVVLHWHGGGLVPFYKRSAPWQRRVIRWTFEHCARIVALSDQWHDTLASLFPCARVAMVPNPVVVPAVRADVATAAPQVLFLGAVKTAKGVDDLIAAWPTVRAAQPAARAVVAGTGEVARCAALAADQGVADAVVFAGWVDADERQRLLLTSAAFTLPSHHEAMPMAVLEAMAAGVPVVATRVGGIPLAVRDGIDGLLVEPHDPHALAEALMRLLGDADLRTRMGMAARRRVEEHFAADVMVPRIDALWRSLLPQSAGAPLAAAEDRQ